MEPKIQQQEPSINDYNRVLPQNPQIYYEDLKPQKNIHVGSSEFKAHVAESIKSSVDKHNSQLVETPSTQPINYDGQNNLKEEEKKEDIAPRQQDAKKIYLEIDERKNGIPPLPTVSDRIQIRTNPPKKMSLDGFNLDESIDIDMESDEGVANLSKSIKDSILQHNGNSNIPEPANGVNIDNRISPLRYDYPDKTPKEIQKLRQFVQEKSDLAWEKFGASEALNEHTLQQAKKQEVAEVTTALSDAEKDLLATFIPFTSALGLNTPAEIFNASLGVEKEINTLQDARDALNVLVKHAGKEAVVTALNSYQPKLSLDEATLQLAKDCLAYIIVIEIAEKGKYEIEVKEAQQILKLTQESVGKLTPEDIKQLANEGIITRANANAYMLALRRLSPKGNKELINLINGAVKPKS